MPWHGYTSNNRSVPRKQFVNDKAEPDKQHQTITKGHVTDYVCQYPPKRLITSEAWAMLESQLGDRSCPSGGRQDCSSSWYLARWRIRKNKQSVWDGQALVMSFERLYDGVQNKWGKKSIVVQSETKFMAVSKMSKHIKGKQCNVRGYVSYWLSLL